MPPQRIMIFGLPGGGKTTCALQLSQRLNLPIHYLDRHFYAANWVERPQAEFLQIQQTLVSQPTWIIDGNAIHSLELRYSQADLVLYFRLNRLLCLYRLILRRLTKSTTHDRAPACPERLTWRLIKYLWQFNTRIAPTLVLLKQRYPTTPFHEFHTQADITHFLSHLQ